MSTKKKEPPIRTIRLSPAQTKIFKEQIAKIGRLQELLNEAVSHQNNLFEMMGIDPNQLVSNKFPEDGIIKVYGVEPKDEQE